jgi:transcriptional regulator with XRE-family HTH domain
VCEGQPWRDALLPPGFLLPQNRRASGGKGRPYLRPVVERVRELVEGSALSQAAIAARTGIGSATVSVWMREKGWRRPLDAYRSAQEVPADRTGLSPRLAAAFARLADLAEGEIASDAALVRLARAARRWAFRYDREGLSRLAPSRRLAPGDPWEPIRISAVPKGPRHHPRGADVLAQAREAWERTFATGETIARELGIGRTTLTRWAQMSGWIRPDGAHSPFAGRPRNRGLRRRIEQRAEALRRLEEAERMMEGAAGHAAFEAVFGLLRDAARIVGRGCPPGGRHA